MIPNRQEPSPFERLTEEDIQRIEKKILDRIPAEWGKYISCEPGWYRLLDRTDTQLAEIFPDYTICQVKQKFGTLCYYCNFPELNPSVSPPTPEEEQLHTEKVILAQTIISRAEEESARTCEECGQPGESFTTNYWVQTLCETCQVTQFLTSRRNRT